MILVILAAGHGMTAEQTEIKTKETTHKFLQKITKEEFDDLWEDDEKFEKIKTVTQKITKEDIPEDELFSCLKEGWALFTQKKYDEAFSTIYLQSMQNVYPTRYLLAEYYEYGLGKINKDIKIANVLYLSVILNSDINWLSRKAEEGYARTLQVIKDNIVIQVTDLNVIAIIENPLRTDGENELFTTMGIGWVLFTQKKYEEAFDYICFMALYPGLKGYLAYYLLAQYNEYGLGKIPKNIKQANEYYLSVLLHGGNELLTKKAEEGHARTVKRSKYKLI